MKKLLLFLVILSSIKTIAQTEERELIKIVLSDSIISHYISEYGGIDRNSFCLYENSGYFLVNNESVRFETQSCKSQPPCSGIISKAKIKKSNAVVKIYFTENQNYITKVKLNRIDENFAWEIKSRLIYNNFHFPKKQSRLVYYSLN